MSNRHTSVSYEQQREKEREEREFTFKKEAEEREFTLKKEAEERDFTLKKEELEVERLNLEEGKGMEEIEKYKLVIHTLERRLTMKEKETNLESFINAKVPKMPFFDEVKDDIDSY